MTLLTSVPARSAEAEEEMQLHLQGYPVSVVIATLGGDCLRDTLEGLNRGNLVPKEILICIPEQEAERVAHLDFPNVRIVITNFRGQVAQRAHGLALVSQLYVLQMDDDITFNGNALLDMCLALENMGASHAVSPAYRNCRTSDSTALYKKGLRGFIQNCVATLICGARWGVARMGTIAPAGIAYGVDPTFCREQEAVSVEWLPGGCVLCFKEDLVTERYFPFAGKAYCEDVIHSVLWRRNSVSLFILPHVDCCIDDAIPLSGTREIMADYRARSYLVELIGGSKFRCRSYTLLFGMKLLVNRLLRQL